MRFLSPSRRLSLALSTLATAALIAACGGGSDADTTPKTSIKAVHVFGDSLADVGTFGGLRFTVNGTGAVTYPERLTANFGVTPLCAYYTPTSASTITDFAPKPDANACTGYAIGGGRINPRDPLNPLATPTTKLSVPLQLADAAAKRAYTATDLLVIDGGGNDAADLVGAYLGAAADSGAAFVGLTSTLVDAATRTAILTNPATDQNTKLAQLGGAYMVALANTFHAAIKTSALDNGATNVVVLNLPGITNTPRFQMVLTGVAAKTNVATRNAVEGLAKTWISAFNSTLANKVSGDQRVVLVDFYKALDQEVATPAQFGLQNAKDTACPAVGLGSDSLPVYDFPTCTAANLSALTPPAGATGGANWWQTYAFSDGFHPTPYGHQLIAQQISLDLAKSGRL